MKGCNYIRERIDEADKPDLLSFEVTEHIAECPDCERFAGERSTLRMLVSSSVRVNAPINFDAVLNARLAEVKARRSFWWLGSPVYFRLGAAAAGLVIMVFVAQYAGLFTDQPRPTSDSQARDAASTPVPTPTFKPFDQVTSVPDLITSPAPIIAASRHPGAGYSSIAVARTRRGDLAATRFVPPGYLTAEDGGVVLVRGQNGEADVQMPTVSVGAQPLMYVRAGQRAVSNIGTSF